MDDIENKSQCRLDPVPLHRARTRLVDKVIPLNRLKTGQSAEVMRIDGPVEHVHRLAEFGLRSGTAIQMFRSGNPCILRMAGNKFCLRPDELLNILVKRNGRRR